MKSKQLTMVIAFAAGCLVTSAIFSGCSGPADRTLSLHQSQSSQTYLGKFRVDTSELPPDAIESTSEELIAENPGRPLTRIHLNRGYEIEIVLRLSKNENSRAPGQ